MKKILIFLVLAGLAFNASAQKFRGGRHYTRPHVVIRSGIYAPYNPYSFYGPYSPYYPYGVYPMRETKLELQIEDIKNDYQDRIWSARHDKTVSRKERKATIHKLKHDRDQAIVDAKRNYYKTRPF